MKITIELEGVASSVASTAAPTANASSSQLAAPTSTDYSLAVLMEKAASMGAINAGPAPAALPGGNAIVPIAASVPDSLSSSTTSAASSAGAPPAHLFGSGGGPQ